MASIGGDYSGNIDARELQHELNRIIKDYNSSIDNVVKDNRELFRLSASYFRWIIYGFVLQAFSVLIFLLQLLKCE